jgi:hypothetical protein
MNREFEDAPVSVGVNIAVEDDGPAVLAAEL